MLLPLLSRRIKALRPGSFPFTAARCFGGGVVVATGFIHVFPEGVALLGNACLGWPDYPVSLLPDSRKFCCNLRPLAAQLRWLHPVRAIACGLASGLLTQLAELKCQ